ncbi:MAG: hypothetical protein J6Q86_04220, partial [Methanobrevibacter sp.]|nr:hypothetical protein [Methanobrevibacter sp.]
QKEYFPRNGYNSAAAQFTAVDSLGNKSFSFFDLANKPRIISYTVQSGIFTATHEMWINNFPPEAEWVDICYSQDGRSFSLRVYL